MAEDFLHSLITSAFGGTAAFFLVWTGLWFPIALPLAIALKWHPPQPVTPEQKLPLLASLYALAPVVLWGAAYWGDRTIADYGLVWTASLWLSAGRGWVLGVAGIAGLLVIQKGLGWIDLALPGQRSLEAETPNHWIGPVLLTLGLGLWISLTEETVFRGFLQNQLQLGYSTWVAAAIASLIFSLLHLVWEGQDNLPQLPGLWLMGMVLVLARWVDHGSLGLAWGLHAGWLWAIASLDTLQAITYTKQGPTWLTGFNQKPLAGGMGLLFLLVTGLVLWLLR